MNPIAIKRFVRIIKTRFWRRYTLDCSYQSNHNDSTLVKRWDKIIRVVKHPKVLTELYLIEEVAAWCKEHRMAEPFPDLEYDDDDNYLYIIRFKKAADVIQFRMKWL